MRVLQLLMVGCVALAAWLVSVNVGGDVSVPAVLEDAMPIAEPIAIDGEQPAFSLDSRFVESAASVPVYILEQRAAPNHRVVQLDPRTGGLVTVWTIPNESLVHSIARSPDGSYLAMAVTVDFQSPGNELVLLDLEDGTTMSVWKGESGDHITDLAWGLDGSVVWATHVSGTLEGAEGLSAIAIGVGTGVIVDEIAFAVHPAPLRDGVAVLEVDLADSARRSIVVLSGDEERRITPDGGTRDLDHLIYDATLDRLLVAALIETDPGLLTIGATADAHGNHNVVSEWFVVAMAPADSADGSGPEAELVEVTSTVVYDAAILSDGTLVVATREGVSVMTPQSETPTAVMASRAFRKVA